MLLEVRQRTELTGKETKGILEKINSNETTGAELQLACPDTSEHNAQWGSLEKEISKILLEANF